MNTTVIVITSIYLLAVLVTAVVSYIGFKCVDSGLEQEPIYYPQVDGITPTVVRQEPCSDAISRQAALHAIGAEIVGVTQEGRNILDCCQFAIKQLPSVHAEPVIHCKDCKYFEYDSMAKVDGIPLIVAHEICSRWGDGCKTREDGFCFLAEPKPYKEEQA